MNEELYGERSVVIDSGIAFLGTVSGQLPDSGLILPTAFMSLYGQKKEPVQDPSEPFPVQSIYKTALGYPSSY